MEQAFDILFRKLCFILHRGFCEMRVLSQHPSNKQLYDLTDAFELFPGFLVDWKDEYLDIIKSTLNVYQDKYKHATFDYIAVLEMNDSDFISLLSRW